MNIQIYKAHSNLVDRFIQSIVFDFSKCLNVERDRETNMSLLDKLRARFANANLSKFAGVNAVLQYNIKENGTVAAVFGEKSILSQ